MGVVSSATQSHRIGLDDLPLELLSKVASCLDFTDILSLQQTSKKLRESTEARVVWLALAKKYSDQHSYLYRPEAGSIDDLTTDELRAWIRKRLVVDQVWGASCVQPRFRAVPTDGGVTLRLVPGGRWLLMHRANASVHYYDLDSKEGSKWAPLTPPSGTVGTIWNSADDLEVHVDECASRLEFKLVVHKPDHGNEGCGQLHVWQVKLGDDGNSLVAKQLNSIPYGYAYIESLALGRHIMAGVMSSPCRVEVIWWEQCSPTRDVRTLFSIEFRRYVKIHIVGDDKILCASDEGLVRLYTLPEPNHTNGYEPSRPHNLPSREPIWSHSLSGGMFTRSSAVYYNGTTCRLTMNMGVVIWGLIFPATKDDDPSVVKLSDISQQWDRCFLGVRKAYAFRTQAGTAARIEYNWDDGGVPTITHFTEKPKDILPSDRYSAFDDEVGRFVYFVSNETLFVDYFQ